MYTHVKQQLGIHATEMEKNIMQTRAYVKQSHNFS